MKRIITKITLLISLIGLLNIQAVSANDVQLKVPKSSIENMLDAFIHARFFSYGGDPNVSSVYYYNFRPINASLTLPGNNRFEINMDFNAYINFELAGFEFEHNYGTKNVTIKGYLSIQTQGDGFKLLLVPDDFNVNASGLLFNVLNAFSGGIIDLLPEISTTAKLPLLVDVATQYFTSTTPSLSTNSNEIILGYTLSAGPRFITVANDVNGNQTVGTIQEVVGSTLTPFSSPKTFEWNTGTTHKVQTPSELLDETNGKNKYRHWLDDDNIVQPEIATRRIQFTVNTDGESYRAKFDEAKRVQLSNSLEGSLSGGTVIYSGTTVSSYDDYDFFHPTQTHSANTNVSNGTHGTNWAFWKWSDGETNKQRTVIVNNNVNLQAEWKGSQRSDNSSTFKASQRKVARSANGWEHLVYESMGRIWYEAKPPSGDWEFIKGSSNRIPLDASGAKLPSIDVNTTQAGAGWPHAAAVVWQQGSYIMVKTFTYDDFLDQYNAGPGLSSLIPTGQSASYNTQPQVIWSDKEEFLVLWRTSSGLKYRIYNMEGNDPPQEKVSTTTISGSSGATNPAASSYTSGLTTWYDVVWEKSLGYLGPPYYTGTEIRHAGFKHYRTNNYTTSVFASHVISSGSVVRNKEPSVISLGASQKVVGWISGLTNGPGWDPWQTRATIATLTWNPYGLNIVRYNNDHHVRSVSVNKLADNSKFYAGWSQIFDQQGWTDYNKFVEGSAMTTFKLLNTKGWDVQLTQAESASDMRASSYYPKTPPYYWEQSNSLGSYLKQRLPEMIHQRGIVLSDSAAASGFYFGVGNITTAGNRIAFKEIEPHHWEEDEFDDQKPPSTRRQSLSEVQPLLTSEPFELREDTELTFREYFSYGDSLRALKLLEDHGYITFKAVLVDDARGEELGILREFTVRGHNGFPRNEKPWKLTNQHNGNRMVRIELQVETNMEELRAEVEETYLEAESLEKTQNPEYEELTIAPKVTSHGLAQNYPNPFNPSTVISYQLPVNSDVRLEVFDLLGRSVATLVNERQSTGRYNITFDASYLASGVYLYRLTAGEFTQSKKLFLIK
ncbi:MAG: T9SS type A sorting domain-containing protein [Gracilimonas sp.]